MVQRCTYSIANVAPRVLRFRKGNISSQDLVILPSCWNDAAIYLEAKDYSVYRMRGISCSDLTGLTGTLKSCSETRKLEPVNLTLKSSALRTLDNLKKKSSPLWLRPARVFNTSSGTLFGNILKIKTCFWLLFDNEKKFPACSAKNMKVL